MSVDYYCDENGGVVFKPVGLMTADVIHPAHESMHTELDASVPYLLVDLLDADGSRLGNHDMATIAERDCRLMEANPGLRVAIVTASFYVSAMNELYRSQLGHQAERVRICDSMVVAQAWLEQGLA